jgi:hypothetical protein
VAKQKKQEWCPAIFSNFITEKQNKLSTAMGRKVTRQEVMAIIAINPPTINIEVKKKKCSGNIFDF